MHWIIGIFMGFMALLGHQTAPKAVAAPIPAIIEAPKGVVLGEGKASLPERLGQTSVTPSTGGLPPATTTSFFNPNYKYMEPENIPAAEPAEVTQPEATPVEEVETKPEYIAPPEADAPLNGTNFSTGGY